MNYKAFELPITIQPNDIDENGHVNNITYLKWVQDIAIAHWTKVAIARYANSITMGSKPPRN
jgi:acyl-CoA thioesterase FadM